MGFFKNLLSEASDSIKKSVEERKQELLKSVEDRKQEFLQNVEDRKREALAKIGLMSIDSDSNDSDIDDNESRIIMGNLEDGVLTISDNFSELDDESLEDYKRLRKIVFPASLKKLDSYVINDQKKLEVVDLSKVTQLKEIPDDFISGKTCIKEFKIPQGVEVVGDGFLGECGADTKVFIPASVKKLGYINGNSDNNQIVYLFASNLDISDVEQDIKTLYVLPEFYGYYAKQLKDSDSEVRLREMPEDMMSIYSNSFAAALTEKPVEDPSENSESESTLKSEPMQAVEPEQEPMSAADGGLFSARLEALINSALQDGILTEKEKAILKKRAEAEGEDWDEVEMIVEARLAEMKPTATVTQVSQTQVQSEVVTPVQESPYLVVNGKEYKDVSIDEIDRDILTNVTGLNASDIISVTIPSSVKRIKKYAFDGVNKLKELVIPSSVERIEDNAFGSILELGDMSYEKLHINCPIVPENAFNGAPLKEVILGDCVNKIEDRAFANCENLKKVDLGKCDKLESIGSYAFGDCKNLTEIDLSNCVSLKHCGGDAFEYCVNIRTIDFSNCESLDLPWFSINSNTKLVLPLGQQTFNKLFLLEQNGYNIDTSKCNNVKVVDDFAFQEMKIKEIVIPDTVETIGKKAFDECENLKTIVMPAALKEIKAPLGHYLVQLKKVDFSKVTQLKVIPKKLIDYGCNKLKELMIPNGVTEIEDDAFLELSNLKKLFLPPTLESIGDLELTNVSIYCFSPSLEELEPIVYGWDDDDDDDDVNWDDEEDDLEDKKEEKKKMKINLYVLPQYLDNYIAQRKAERIPEDILVIDVIPEEYRYYYDN